METMLVSTCLTCRAWYVMDYEEEVDSEHYNMRTGELCLNNDSDNWVITIAPKREDWQIAN